MTKRRTSDPTKHIIESVASAIDEFSEGESLWSFCFIIQLAFFTENAAKLDSKSLTNLVDALEPSYDLAEDLVNDGSTKEATKCGLSPQQIDQILSKLFEFNCLRGSRTKSLFKTRDQSSRFWNNVVPNQPLADCRQLVVFFAHMLSNRHILSRHAKRSAVKWLDQLLQYSLVNEEQMGQVYDLFIMSLEDPDMVGQMRLFSQKLFLHSSFYRTQYLVMCFANWRWQTAREWPGTTSSTSWCCGNVMALRNGWRFCWKFFNWSDPIWSKL